MAIIPEEYLVRELSDDVEEGDLQFTAAVDNASIFCNTHATHYEAWPDYTGSAGAYTIVAPSEIQRVCTEIAKIYYQQIQGRVSRDGKESESLMDQLKSYKDMLMKIDIRPTISSVAISLNSDGVQLIARNQNILRFHPSCRVTSDASNIWNQLYHWDIRRGLDAEDEQIDGWYFDAETYKDTIEGTLYYARSWRNDGLDYQRFERRHF